MARVHFWKFLVNEAGEPIEGANIYVTEAGTDEPVWVYYDEFSSAGSIDAPQVVTLENGYFEFWIAEYVEGLESNPPADESYTNLNKFKIRWEKTGVSNGYIDYVDIFPPNRYYQPVDETDSASTIKNKVVSNALAYQWSSHTNGDVTDGGGPHNIYPINIEGYDSDITPLPEINKVVSNALGWKWDYHTESTIQEVKQQFIDEPDPIADVYPRYPHGIQEGDPLSQDTVRNKLVSNSDLYILHHSKSEIFDVGSIDWVPNVDGHYEYTLNHNLDENYPGIQAWKVNVDTSVEMITLDKVFHVDANKVLIVVYDEPFDAKIRVIT